MIMSIISKVVYTQPFDGQKPGTSGLRKPTKTFIQVHYTQNFVQCTLTAALGQTLKGCTLVIGGDGRYYGEDATRMIVQMCAANGVNELVIAKLN